MHGLQVHSILGRLCGARLPICHDERHPALGETYGEQVRYVRTRDGEVILILVVSRSSRRSSVYNAVTPVPEPLVLLPGTHPLKRKVAPRLLGIWPTSSMTEEIQERGSAPDYLPMFAFPNDIQVKLSDERPRSTWHGFVSHSHPIRKRLT